MHDVRKVFEDRDTDKSGHIDMSEMSAAMKALNVKLSEDEVKSLFEVRNQLPRNRPRSPLQDGAPRAGGGGETGGKEGGGGILASCMAVSVCP